MTICVFMYFHYIPIAAATFCQPFHHISGGAGLFG